MNGKEHGKIYDFLYRYRREGLLFLLLFMELLRTLPASIYDWCNAWFVTDYSLGLDSRLLIGSLLRLLHPDYLSERAAYHFVLLSLVLLLVLIAGLLGYALRQLKNHPAGIGLLFLVLVWLVCPGSPAYLWTTENMGRLDLYLLILTLLGAVFHFKLTSVTGRLVCFTVTGLLAVCVHQAFLFIFFPLLFVFFIDTMTEFCARRRHQVLGAAGILLIAGAAVYFQFFSSINTPSAEALAASLSERTDLMISETPLQLEYFSDFSTTTFGTVSAELGERIRYGLITVFLLSPLWAVYGFVWTRILQTLRHGIDGALRISAEEKFKYITVLLSQLCFVPAFVFTMDWGRWFGAFLTVQALQIVFLAAKKDAVVLSALSSLSASVRRHPWLFLVTGVYLASFHKFEAVLLPDAPVFFTSVYRFFTMLFH